MQKSKTLLFKPYNVFSLLKEGYALLIMFFVYIIGIVFGVLLYREEQIFADVAIKQLSIADETVAFWDVFLTALLRWAPFLVILLMFGMCVIGVAIIPLSVVIKGIEYGIIAAHLYSTYSLSGIVYVLILIIPSSMIAAFSLFFAARDSFKFSLRLLRHVLPEPRGEFLYPHFIRYCKKLLLFLFVIIIAAIVDATLQVAFFGIIKL